jgi:hypothetical protein
MNRALVFTLTNALIFQLGWFVCILGGSALAVGFTAIILFIHFFFVNRRCDDAIAVVLAVILGLAHDLLLIHTGQIQFLESAQLPPMWLVCLWALLGITLNHSLQWIYYRPLWSSLLGAMLAPLSYLAGVTLSSAEWSSPLVEVLPIIAALWLVILPLHRFLSLRISSYVQCKTTK